MADWSYMSLDVLKANVADTSTRDDAAYRRVLEAVTEEIDNWCERTFRTYLATRVLTAKNAHDVHVPDLLSITTLKTDLDGDGTFETTWTTGDYRLEPRNAQVDRLPYREIETKRYSGTQFFPLDDDGVQVVGKWGYWESLEAPGVTLAEALDASETGVDVSSGSALDVLDTILVDSEQMYITAISTNTLTVVRGVNGTTAATHDNGATVYRYRYPAPVVEACGIQASRIFKRRGAPFGVVGTADSGFYRIRTLDPDVQDLLGRYTLVGVG
jgi:hypothetical protein